MKLNTVSKTITVLLICHLVSSCAVKHRSMFSGENNNLRTSQSVTEKNPDVFNTEQKEKCSGLDTALPYNSYTTNINFESKQPKLSSRTNCKFNYLSERRNRIIRPKPKSTELNYFAISSPNENPNSLGSTITYCSLGLVLVSLAVYKIKKSA